MSIESNNEKIFIEPKKFSIEELIQKIEKSSVLSMKEKAEIIENLTLLKDFYGNSKGENFLVSMSPKEYSFYQNYRSHWLKMNNQAV